MAMYEDEPGFIGPRFARGGLIEGSGDTAPFLAGFTGCPIIRESEIKYYGIGLFSALNEMQVPANLKAWAIDDED